MTLDLSSDPIALTRAIVDIESVSGNERALADEVEAALRAIGRFEVVRDGDAVLARTDTGKPRRILLAGHLDTVPVAGNLPSKVDGDRLYGCGTSDMKSGVAVMLHAAAVLPDPAYDLTLVCYDCEEIESERNGLGRIARTRRDWLDCDLAVVLEPTNGAIEGGCQGTMRAVVTTSGIRAHSARSWLGSNAIHAAGEILTRLSAYEPRVVPIDGCVYREGLNAVWISGGVAGNVIPDECTVTVNYRFAPDRDEAAAAAHVREVFAGFDVRITDSAPSAPPGLSEPAARAFVAAIGGTPVAKYGWTDVGRFATLGIPAVNFGPGDPNMAHKRDEYCRMPLITASAEALVRFLAG
ncbi:succinyl-diaminopimelate desuccinylase [Fodinicola acaciae]|uniref:succinyl-diaminopimelate desuccinylase n=1 Tax=Fodinicola acaciae TaxID=2681555 RepID=UPI0013D7C16D|nr:succinyl-diaminopimelate desuccinylase [Fodinicola acaciae]